MLEKLEDSAGSVVGYKVVGKVTVQDYRKLEPAIENLANQHDSVKLLFDLRECSGEEVKAWLPDLKFGQRFHDRIGKMAIVGDKRWQRWLTALVSPWYAKEGRFFLPEESDEAWTWLRQEE
jgi:hypothetical protein